jgi:hypothetical protein
MEGLCRALRERTGASAEADGRKSAESLAVEASESWSTLRITQLCWIAVMPDFVRGRGWKKERQQVAADLRKN